jgi:predicted negative regulator of RcsB-dependent stress response
MNLLDTTTASPVEQANHLKKQNKEQVIAFISGLIGSLEKMNYSRFSEEEVDEARKKDTNHINYWRAVKAEFLKDEPKNIEPLKQGFSKTKSK